MSKQAQSKANESTPAHPRATENGAQAADEPLPSPTLEMMCKTLAGLQDQVKFADTKATFTAGLNVLLFGFVVANAEKLAAIPAATRSWAFYSAAILLILYGLAAFVSMILVILIIMPRFGDLAPQSRTHFAHILKGYGKDYGRYCRDVQNMTFCDWAEDIGTQIVEVSHIAKTKHWLARWAAISTLAALGTWVGGLIAALIAHHG